MTESSFDHSSWREILRELQQNRETLARVCTGFVLSDDLQLAKKVAEEYAAAAAAVKAHLEILPGREAQKDAN